MYFYYSYDFDNLSVLSTSWTVLFMLFMFMIIYYLLSSGQIILYSAIYMQLKPEFSATVSPGLYTVCFCFVLYLPTALSTAGNHRKL